MTGVQTCALPIYVLVVILDVCKYNKFVVSDCPFAGIGKRIENE